MENNEGASVQDLLSTNELFNTLFYRSKAGMALIDVKGRILDVNDFLSGLLEYPKEELRGKRFTDITYKHDIPESEKLFNTLFEEEGEGEFKLDKRYVTKNGRVIWANTTCLGLEPSNSHKRIALGIVQDITQHKKLKDIFDDAQSMASIGGWEWDLVDDELFFTKETYRIHELPWGTPITPEEAIAHYPHPHDQRIRESLNNATQKGQAFDRILRFTTAKGNDLWVRSMGRPYMEKGEITKLRGTIQDVTEKHQLEEYFRDAVLDAQEEEKRRIAEDLHDGLGQLLSSMNMQLNALEDNIGEEGKEIFHQLKNVLNESIQQTRSISRNMMPPELKGRSLIEALDKLKDDISQTGEIRVNFDHDQHEEKFDTKTKSKLFRVTQECLNNIVKHANAKNVWIDLRTDEMNGLVHLDVQDDGIGFDKSGIKSKGIGLRSLSEKIRFLHGDLKIDSQPGAGTRIHAELPIQD